MVLRKYGRWFMGISQSLLRGARNFHVLAVAGEFIESPLRRVRLAFDSLFCASLAVVFRGSLIVMSGFLLHGCDRPYSQQESGSVRGVAVAVSQAAEAGSVAATLLLFEEVEPGVSPYTVRMLVTERYIRIDDGPDAPDFVLYDHVENRVYSVLADNRQIFVVEPAGSYVPASAELALREEYVEDGNMPAIAGVVTRYFRFFADDRLCYHVVAADGFLPEVSAMLVAYQRLLATQQQEVSEVTPMELQTPCFLANYLYVPETYMSKGFPVRQWDETGYRRSLEDVEVDYRVDAGLFALPDSYRYFGLGVHSRASI